MNTITKEELQNLIGNEDAVGKYFQIEVLDFADNFAKCAMPTAEQFFPLPTFVLKLPVMPPDVFASTHKRPFLF